MTPVWAAFRYAVRGLRRNPASAVLVVLALSIGIGGTTAVFTVLKGVVFRPLPLPEPDRVFELQETNRVGERVPVAMYEATELSARSRTVEDLAIVTWDECHLELAPGTHDVLCASVGASFFSILGARLPLGRSFDKESKSDLVAVISSRLWRREFGGNPDVLGKSLRLDGRQLTVIGVLPADSFLPWHLHRADIFLPVTKVEDIRMHNLYAIGRLAKGAGLDGARAEFQSIMRSLSDVDPTVKGWGAVAIPLKESIIGGVRTGLEAAFGSILIVLMVVCANVAVLLLVRSITRTREMAIRAALGAGRIHVGLQMLFEGIVLATAAGLLGLVLAILTVRALLGAAPADIPRLQEVHVDAGTVSFLACVTLIVGALAGIAPAIRVYRFDLLRALKESSETTTVGAARSRSLHLLVVSQISLAVVVAVCTGLLVRSLYKVLSIPIGFDPADKSAMLMTVLGNPPPKVAAALTAQALERVSATSGIEAAATVDFMPLQLGRGWRESVLVEGRSAASPDHPDYTMLNWASPGYFHTLEIPLLRGRDFGPADTVGTAPVAIVNEVFARQYFGKEDPIGKHVTPIVTYAGAEKPKARRIIAVVGNASHFFLEATVQPEVYMPQLQDGLPDATIVVRSHLPVARVESEVRAALSAIDRRLSLGSIHTVGDLIETQLAWRKFIVLIGVVFASTALVFAAVGLYAILSFSVAQRRRELAIRKALGASPWALAALIMRRGIAISSIGAGTGVLISLAVTKLVSSMLYDVAPADPVAFVSATAILLSVSLFASTWPARKAIRGDLGIVMRAE